VAWSRSATGLAVGTYVDTLTVTALGIPLPVVLYDSVYWTGLLDWLRGTMLAERFIAETDLDSLIVSDDPDEVVSLMLRSREPA